MRTFELTMSIELTNETVSVKVHSSLPGDGDVDVIIGQLNNLREGLLSKLMQKMDRDLYINYEEAMEILKSLTIKDLKK